MQYCLAVALLQGRLSLSDFTRDAVSRSSVRQHMAKIAMDAYSAEEERGVERLPHQLSVKLQDGRILQAERLHARGSIACPLTDEEKLAKFTDCLRWAGIEGDQMHGVVGGLGDAPSVRTALEGIVR